MGGKPTLSERNTLSVIYCPRVRSHLRLDSELRDGGGAAPTFRAGSDVKC